MRFVVRTFPLIVSFPMDEDMEEFGSEGDSDGESESAEPKENVSSLPPKRKRARKNFLTPRLATVLDKIKISEREAVHLFVAVLEALQLDPAEYVINRTSIRKLRDEYRKSRTSEIMNKFLNHPQAHVITAHWDGKILNNVRGQKEDRLAVVATAPDAGEQILNIPDIPAGTGQVMANAVYDSLEEAGITDRVEAFSFDTTSSNTGRIKGACVLLERKIGRDILFLGCRHHIFEIILAAVFGTVAPSKGPEITIFKDFKHFWPKINQNNFKTGVTDSRIKKIMGNEISKVLEYAILKIEDDLPRDDYKEFLELIIIFLGGVPPRGIKFSKPGAMHSARWMSRAIYTLKILLFRKQFSNLDKSTEKKLVEVAGFVTKCYTRYWFECPKAECAPLNDIEFLKDVKEYCKINPKISDMSIKKFINHLYYLNEECVGFAFFDDRISPETKDKMAAKIQDYPEPESDDEELEDEEDPDESDDNECENEEEVADDVNDDKECENEVVADERDDEESDDEEFSKKLLLNQSNLNEFLNRESSAILVDLVTRRTKNVFKRFRINTEFLEEPASRWSGREDYERGKEYVKKLKVVNDCAERSIRLLDEYHNEITMNEEQKQYVFKVGTYKPTSSVY